MRKAFYYILPLAACFLVGFLASQLQEDAIRNWYPYLDKPVLTPPNKVFPIAWSILYVFMAISIGLIINNTWGQRRKYFIILFTIQLTLNFLWSILFFHFRNPFWGMIDIVLLLIMLIIYSAKSYEVNKAASILFWPYILWVCFASYLNFYILLNN